MKKASLLLLSLFLLLVMCCESREHSIMRENGYISEHPPEDVAHYWRDVPYAEVEGMPLTLDVSAPEGPGPFPVLMIIHGGGWELHTNTIMEGMARYITNRGYVVFNINYRTLPEGVRIEEIVEDCMGALLWVKDLASDYKGDPERVAITGDSAGGHLTAMIVTQANNPAFTPTYRGEGDADLSVTCAAPSYGVYNFESLYRIAPPVVKRYMGEWYWSAPGRYELLSPVKHVRAGLPPQLVIVGNRDPLYWQNVHYVERLKEAGSPAELWVFNGQSHAFLNNYWEEKGRRGYDRIIEFLDKHMK